MGRVPIGRGGGRDVDRIDHLLASYSGEVPGASLLVLRDGRIWYRQAWGLADLDTGRRATPTTNYRLASISKQFTATAILLLVQDGVLTLDQPLRQWLPTLPAAIDGATLRHALCHRTGVPDYEDFVDPAAAGQWRDANVLALLETLPHTLFAPGSAWRYSNGGYALLALVVERASGMAFEDFLQSRIFGPLGMSGTLARTDAGPAVPERAFGNRRGDGRWITADQDATSAVLGDGGIYSSVDDLAKWDAALDDDRLLCDPLRREAFSVQSASDDPDVDYGLGWRISGDVLWHSGESIGFRNVMLRRPSSRATASCVTASCVTVILLTNRDEPSPLAIARDVMALALAEA
jgi:CubicO group peptidase (beta-lactamase class C family)